METIKLKVSNQCIVADRKYLVSDTKEVYQCEFEFDDEWASYGKTATFRQNDSITEMVLVNNACVLPYEAITQKGYMQIGVYGDNSTKHYPTIWCEPIFVYEGVTEGEEHEDPTPDVYQQIISALNQKEDKSNKVTSLSSSSTDTQYPSAKVVYDELDDKVDKIQGKGLSQNDFTDTLKSKLDGIQSGAEVNVQSDWNQTDSSKDDFIKNKPSIPTLDNYYTKGETDSAISNHHDSTKQNTLVSGTNIKTINNQSILGSGNIEIQGGGEPNAYLKSASISGQTLTLTNKDDSTTTFTPSEEDFTSSLKSKLDEIESNAQVNVLEGVQVNGSDLPISNKKVNIPKATNGNDDSHLGLVKIKNKGYGIDIDSNGAIYTIETDESGITNRTNGYSASSHNIISPRRLNFAVKSALSDSNRISDMTDTEKANARGVIGAIALSDIPNATYNETQKNYGLVAIGDGYGCLTISNDYLVVRKASDYNITNRHSTVVLDPSRINHAVKCALTDSFGIGTGTGGRAPLTDTEKQKAWGVFSIIKTTMDSVAVCNAQYYLGEQSSVSITMPSSALVGQEILVVFSSGSTPCTLTCDLQGFSFVPKANKTSYIKFTCVDSTNMNWIVETKEG